MCILDDFYQCIGLMLCGSVLLLVAVKYIKIDETDYIGVDDSTFGSEPTQSRSDHRQVRDGPGEHMDDRLDTVRTCVSDGHFGSPFATDALLLDVTSTLCQNSCLCRPLHLRVEPP